MIVISNTSDSDSERLQLIMRNAKETVVFVGNLTSNEVNI